MFDTFRNAWKIAELRKKLLFTLMILVIFRLGSAIPVPFITAGALQGFMQQAASAHAIPMIPEMKEVWGYGGDLLLRVLAGDEDPAQVVGEAVTLINEANGK